MVGGDRYGIGRAGKSEFPEDWSDDKVIYETLDVATDPTAASTPQHRGRTKVTGTRT